MTDHISTLGFNAEYLDSTLDNYHLGNGYRVYNPTTMQFTAPDDMSPFGSGGINPYMYVSCDPINNTDPTGHFNFLGVGVNLGMIAFGIGSAVAAVATGGVSIGATIAIAGALYGTYTGIQGIAKDAQQNHQGLSTEEAINLGVTVGTEVLGWGAPKLFEKLSTPLAKVAENGPFKLSGGPEDAARAGEHFRLSNNTNHVRFAPLPAETSTIQPITLNYHRFPDEDHGTAITRELHDMVINRGNPNFDRYNAIIHKKFNAFTTRNPLWDRIRGLEVNSRHIQLTMENINHLRNSGRYLGWVENENRLGTYYHYIADINTPSDIRQRILELNR